jgi:hypothetical protein
VEYERFKKLNVEATFDAANLNAELRNPLTHKKNQLFQKTSGVTIDKMAEHPTFLVFFIDVLDSFVMHNFLRLSVLISRHRLSATILCSRRY